MNNERIGLLLIAASLAAIVTVVGLSAHFQRHARMEELRRQGVALVSLVAKLPLPSLISPATEDPLGILSAQMLDDFAYAVAIDPQGRRLRALAAPGFAPPEARVSPEPAAWTSEREMDANGRTVREFSAPILKDGELTAQLRVGVFEPEFGRFLRHDWLAMLALPIFLLTPLCYFVLRRVVQPLDFVGRRIRELTEEHAGPPAPTAGPGGEIGELLAVFNRFVEENERRLQELHAQQNDRIVSSKVRSYRQARSELVLESLPEAALVLDGTGTVIFANAKFEGVTGLPAQDVLGRGAADWCPHTEVVAFLSRYAGSASRPRSDCLRFQPEGDGDDTIAVEAYPLLPPDGGGSPGTLVLFRDVTESVIAERAQGEFVTHVAHELKNPLHTFAVYGEMLMGKDGEAEEFRLEAGNVIQDQVTQLSTLIDTLMSIARIEGGTVRLDRQRIRVEDFLHETVDHVSKGSKATHLHFRVDVPKDMSPLQVDKELLRVALNNLLTNAIKYSEEGGTIVLRAEEDDERIALRVTDTGIGMTPEECQHVFDRFYRSERAEVRLRPGHGLGLTLCRVITELHGGRVEVESELGEGSTFSLILRRTSALIRESL